MFENTTRDDRGIGDGAYLFDPQGDIRASMIYPCRIGCADPAAGPGLDRRQPRRRTRSSRSATTRRAAIDLENYLLKSPPYSYAFPPGSILQPGETMRVSTQGDPARRHPLEKFWGMTSQILNNGGDSATLVSYTDVTARLHRVGLEVLLSDAK